MTPISLGLGLGLVDRSAPTPFLRATPGAYAALGGVSAFTRADASTCATYVDVNGNVPTVAAGVLRDSHYIGGVRTFLLESSRQNAAWSNDPSQAGAGWTGANRTVNLNRATPLAPDGTQAATQLLATVAAAANWYRTLTAVGTSMSVAICAHLGSFENNCNIFGLYNITSSTALSVFTVNYATGAIAYILGTSAGATATALGNGWWLIRISQSTLISNGDTIRFWTGQDGTAINQNDDCYVWNCNVENAAYSTSLIPTAGAAVTRAVDALTLAGTSAYSAPATLYQHYWDLATQAWVGAASAYTPGTAIVPTVDRAYMTIAVCVGTLSAAACRALIGGTFP